MSFFIKKCIENSVLWGLGGSKTKAVGYDSIAGYDEQGDRGKWKGILKYSYKIDKQTKERIYQEYPPRLDFEIIKDTAHATFKTIFYNDKGVKIQDVNIDNIIDILPYRSHVEILASWSTISLGTYGATLKPKAIHINIFLNKGFDNEICHL